MKNRLLNVKRALEFFSKQRQLLSNATKKHLPLVPRRPRCYNLNQRFRKEH